MWGLSVSFKEIYVISKSAMNILAVICFQFHCSVFMASVEETLGRIYS